MNIITFINKLGVRIHSKFINSFINWATDTIQSSVIKNLSCKTVGELFQNHWLIY